MANQDPCNQTTGDKPKKDTLGPVLAELPRPRVPDPITVIVVADVHLAVAERGTWKVLHRTEARLRSALQTARGENRNSPAEAVLFVGDQTNDGRRAEFDRFAKLLDGLEMPWAAVPGNHDVPKAFDDHRGVAPHRVRQRFLGDAEPVAESPREYPTILHVGQLRVVCLNTAAPPDVDLSDTWAGALGPAGQRRLRETLAEHADLSTLVLAHHNLGRLPEHEPAYPWERFPADDARAVRELLVEADVPLVVTGHHHVPAVRDHGGLVELMAPATCSFPQAALSLRVGPCGTTIRLVPLADREEIREAYWHAATGKLLGQGVLELAVSRVARL